MKLNIGCGNYPILAEGWVNLDKKGLYQEWEHGNNAKYIREFDLLSFPYDFNDNSIDCITISHTLNQVGEHEKIFKEFYRILKPRGILRITDDNNVDSESKYFVPHIHTVTKMCPDRIVDQLYLVGFVGGVVEKDFTEFEDRNILVDNHPNSGEHDKFFIEVIKWVR